MDDIGIVYMRRWFELLFLQLNHLYQICTVHCFSVAPCHVGQAIEYTPERNIGNIACSGGCSVTSKRRLLDRQRKAAFQLLHPVSSSEN